MKTPLAIFSTFLAVIPTVHSATVTRGPYLQSPSNDRIIICWRTDVPTTSEVTYGPEVGTLPHSASTAGTRTDHAVTLTNLNAHTQYHYRIKGTPASGAAVDLGGSQYWFRTSPAAGTATPTRVFVVGDSGYQTNYADFTLANYLSLTQQAGRNTDIFLMLGDNAYPWGADSSYQGAMFNRYGQLLRNVATWSAIGNHDVSIIPENHPPAAYFSVFNFPTAGECGGAPSGNESYYSFNHGNIRFICLDTNTTAHVSDEPGGAYGMVDWLQDDLMTCSSDWIIAYMHQPPYSKGSHDSDVESELVKTRNHIIPMLEAHGVDLVLCGHSHSYERSVLINGHYGNSSTWNASTMRKWPGNGSDLGGVNAAGAFVTGPPAAGGAYQKPAATANAGAVYAVSGGASSVQSWNGGFTALVNPNPHPVHLVNLLAIGAMVLNFDGPRLNVQYLGQSGEVMDDFTILKGSTYTLQPPSPTTEGGVPGIAFPVSRTGTTFDETVIVKVDSVSGGGVTPLQASAVFAAGQSQSLAKFLPSTPGTTPSFEASILPSTRAVQPGAAQRSAYKISGGVRTGQFSATPSGTWYASRFASEPNDPEIWESDSDGDGLSLLLEYALGGEPGRNDAALIPRGSIESGMFVYRYHRPHGRTDLNYRVKGSPNLASWTNSGISDTNDGPETVSGEPRKAAVAIGSSPYYLRLEVELLD